MTYTDKTYNKPLFPPSLPPAPQPRAEPKPKTRPLTRSPAPSPSAVAASMAAEAASAPSSSARPPAAFPATRQEIQAAIAKATELRALHAALLQGGGANAAACAAYAGAGAGAGRSPAVIRVPPAASPAFPRAAAVAEDYPVFTPAYGEEPLGGMNYIRQDNRSLSENWSGIGLDHEGPEDEVAFSDLDNHNTFSSSNSELHFSSSNEHMRNRIPRRNHHSFLHPALSADSFLKSASRRTDSAESKATTTCNTCKPATISRGPEADANAPKNLTSGVPQSNYHPSVGSRTRQKGTNVLSWLLPKSKRKTKSDMSPNTAECENMSQLLKEWGVFSLESLKKELAEANEHRDAALQEVGEMRSSLGELTSKLLSLEAYSSELKKALKKATSTKNVQSHSKRSARSVGVSRDDSLPVSHEVMVEGFLQIVSEARLSIKQFCKVLLQQVEDADNGLADKLNLLLQPYQLTLADKHSKVILYHLEALMNQAMYQDFENCTFQKNGSPRFLDPKQDLQENFASFVALRNLSWNEVLKKGTKYYCEDFSRFCDQKMSCIVSMLSWSWPWAEQLLQCFFVAAKCIWLLHLLAFSFSPPLMVLRVEENRAFDPMYMEEIQVERQRSQQNPSRVKIMAMPGFYVQDRVLKCRVICRHS